MTTEATKAKKAANYTEAQEQRIRDLAAENGGLLNAASAETLATEFGKTPRSVIAKAVRMELYKSKEPTTKSGEPIEHKDDLVAEIGRVVEGNLAGLEKAPKAALVAIRNFVNSAEG